MDKDTMPVGSGRVMDENGSVKNIADGINNDGSLNVLNLATVCDFPQLGELIASASRSANASSPQIDLRDLYHKVGTDQMMLMLAVSVIGSGNTIELDISYYNTNPATGLLNSTAGKTVSAVVSLTANGTAVYSIPVADQFWPGMLVTMNRSVGSSSWTAAAYLGYVSAKAVRQ